jgi:hypothetical protein
MLIMLLRGNPSKRQQVAWRNWTSGRPLRKQSGPNQDQTNKMQGSQTKPTPNRIHSSLKRNWQVRNGQFLNFHAHTLWWFCQFAASFVFPGLKTADFLHENLRCGLGRLFQMLGPKVLLEVLHLSPKGLELDDKCAMVMSSPGYHGVWSSHDGNHRWNDPTGCPVKQVQLWSFQGRKMA